jgi:hypothetical protein
VKFEEKKKKNVIVRRRRKQNEERENKLINGSVNFKFITRLASE